MFKPHYSQLKALKNYAMSCNARMRCPYLRFILHWEDISSLVTERYSKEEIISDLHSWNYTYFITYDGIVIKVINIKNGEIERTFERTEF